LWRIGIQGTEDCIAEDCRRTAQLIVDGHPYDAASEYE
jgi:hypothetical protein